MTTERAAAPRPTKRTLRITGDTLFSLLANLSRYDVQAAGPGIPEGAAIAGTRVAYDQTRLVIELDVVWHDWPPEQRDEPLELRYRAKWGDTGRPTDDWGPPQTLTVRPT